MKEIITSEVVDARAGRNAKHFYSFTAGKDLPPLELKKDGTPKKRQTKRNEMQFHIPSVTRVLNQIEPFLIRQARLKITAEFAVNERYIWENQSDDVAQMLIKNEHKRLWGIKAMRGTLTHATMQALGRDEQFDFGGAFSEHLVPLCRTEEEAERNWEEMNLGPIAAVYKFFDNESPQFSAIEQTVVEPGVVEPDNKFAIDNKSCYAGCFDAVTKTKTLGETITDWKTGFKDVRKVHRQLVAYQNARYRVKYDDNGHVTEINDNEMPKNCAVVYFCDDGNYEMVLFDDEAENNLAFEEFARLRAVFDDEQNKEKQYKIIKGRQE